MPLYPSENQEKVHREQTSHQENLNPAREEYDHDDIGSRMIVGRRYDAKSTSLIEVLDN